MFAIIIKEVSLYSSSFLHILLLLGQGSLVVPITGEIEVPQYLSFSAERMIFI